MRRNQKGSRIVFGLRLVMEPGMANGPPSAGRCGVRGRERRLDDARQKRACYGL